MNKIFSCAARMLIGNETSLFSGLVEAENIERAEQKLIRYLTRLDNFERLLGIVVTDRYFDDDMNETEITKIIEDFPIE